MDNCLLSELERTFKKCSDCLLHPDYIANLNKLNNIELSQELIDYLCDKATSKKHIWEIRFDHLRILLLNSSARAFDLKEFYFENLKKCRRLAMKIFLYSWICNLCFRGRIESGNGEIPKKPRKESRLY